MPKKKQIKVEGNLVSIQQIGKEDYISLTDMARKFNSRTEIILQRWMRNRNTVEYLALWERFHNKDFNHTHLSVIRENDTQTKHEAL